MWLRAMRRPRSRDAAAVIAEDADRHVVGRAGYRRVYGPRADLTLDVPHGVRRRDLAAMLVCDLGARAAESGISTFLMRVRADDRALLALLHDDFGAISWNLDDGHVELELSVAGACGRTWLPPGG